MDKFLIFLLFIFTISCSIDIPKEIVNEYSNIPEEIDFNYHVKPILSDRCFQCHGPD